MYNLVSGDMFAGNYEALTNAVNCDGVMGGGLALAFKKKFPDMYADYKKCCVNGLLRPGQMHISYVSHKGKPCLIINFPTKDEVYLSGKMSYIVDGLPELRKTLEKHQIKTCAVPALGCGLAGLNWEKVKPLIMEEFKESECVVDIYEPHEG